ncbi:MAG TPA: response regulator [Alphaproteobacteria bacterium]|nr:response regulator [Alphaproteobacteria bacterium]
MSGVSLNAASTASKVVIGVDDAPENLFMLQATLKQAGYSFLGAKSGLECLTLVSRVIPRLILLDVEMPELDGFETCRKLRANPELRHVPIAFLTARKTPADVNAGLAAGGNDFIVKPFDQVKLLDRVRHWTTRSVGRNPVNQASGP